MSTSTPPTPPSVAVSCIFSFPNSGEQLTGVIARVLLDGPLRQTTTQEWH